MEKEHVVLEIETYNKLKKSEEKLEYTTTKKEQLEKELSYVLDVLYKSFNKDFKRQDSLNDFLDEFNLKLNFDNTAIIFKHP